MSKTVATILLFFVILFIANNYRQDQAVSTPVVSKIEVVTPAAASETSTTKKADPMPSLWTCSTDETVIYMVIEGNNQNFTVFASNGTALGQAVFSQERTDDGRVFMYAELRNTAIAAARTSETTMVVMFIELDQPGLKFECQ